MDSWLLAAAVLPVVALVALGCGAVGGERTISGEVRFVRDVDLPDGAVVIVTLLDTSYADAPSMELGRDVIEDAEGLPVRYRIAYDPAEISDRNEYTLSARVELRDDLLYINDTVHPVLTRGAPRNSDIAVISTNPFDQCVEPLPGEIHASFSDEELPDGAVMRVRLVDVTEPEQRLVVTEASFEELGSFPDRVRVAL